MRIIYARGFPYGAPWVCLRGGGTKDPDVKLFLAYLDFHWDSEKHGYVSYMYGIEFKEALLKIKEEFPEMEIVPKADMNPDYVLDLED